MMETSTSVKNQNHLQSQTEQAPTEDPEILDILHGQMKSQLDLLRREPSKDSIQKILDYSRAGNFK